MLAKPTSGSGSVIGTGTGGVSGSPKATSSTPKQPAASSSEMNKETETRFVEKDQEETEGQGKWSKISEQERKEKEQARLVKPVISAPPLSPSAAQWSISADAFDELNEAWNGLVTEMASNVIESSEMEKAADAERRRRKWGRRRLLV